MFVALVSRRQHSRACAVLPRCETLETQKWLFSFPHQSNRLTMLIVQCTSSKYTRNATQHVRWVTLAETSGALTTNRQLFGSFVDSPCTWTKQSGAQSVCFFAQTQHQAKRETIVCRRNEVSSTTCSLFCILCRKPFNLEPCQRSAGRRKMENCR